MSVRAGALIVQAVSFIVLGVVLVMQGQWKLGVAQLMLAVIQVLIYS